MLSAASLFLMGMVAVPLYKAANRKWRSLIVEQKKAVDAVLGIPLPSRGAFVFTINEEQFDAILFADIKADISFILLVSKPGSELSLEEMLIALDSRKKVAIGAPWGDLIPVEVLGSEQLNLASGEVAAQSVRLKKRDHALLVPLEINGKRALVVAYRSFNGVVPVEEVERFLDELLVSSE